MEQRHKRRFAVGSLFLGILVLLLFWNAYTSSSQMRVLDPSFKVVDVQLSRSKTHSFYSGGLQGRLRQKLHEFGVPVTRLGGLQMDFGNDTLALAVCFGGDLSWAEAQSVEAVLVAAGGGVTVLPSKAQCSIPTRKEHACGWTLGATPPRGTVLQLRLGTNRPLAEMVFH